MKKIFKIALPLVMLGGCASSEPVAADIEPIIVETNKKSVTWYPKKFMMVQTICRDEKSVMDLVKADTTSAEKLAEKVVEFTFNPNSTCKRLMRPMISQIIELVVQYQDFTGAPSLVLKVKLGPKGPVAYALAEGNWSESKPVKKEKILSY